MLLKGLIRFFTARFWLSMVAIFLIGFAIRVLLLSFLHFRPIEHVEPINLAISLVEKGDYADPFGGPTGPSAHCMPLHPLPSALLIRIFGVGLRGELCFLVGLCTFAVVGTKLRFSPKGRGCRRLVRRPPTSQFLVSDFWGFRCTLHFSRNHGAGKYGGTPFALGPLHTGGRNVMWGCCRCVGSTKSRRIANLGILVCLCMDPLFRHKTRAVALFCSSLLDCAGSIGCPGRYEIKLS
jgi:hypothetical protein